MIYSIEEDTLVAILSHLEFEHVCSLKFTCRYFVKSLDHILPKWRRMCLLERDTHSSPFSKFLIWRFPIHELVIDQQPDFRLVERFLDILDNGKYHHVRIIVFKIKFDVALDPFLTFFFIRFLNCFSGVTEFHWKSNLDFDCVFRFLNWKSLRHIYVKCPTLKSIRPGAEVLVKILHLEGIKEVVLDAEDMHIHMNITAK